MSDKKKILIVEDERQILESLKDFFILQSYDVLGAATGNEGLALGLAEDPELIVLDIMLPGMHGFDVCRGLRSGGYSGRLHGRCLRHPRRDQRLRHGG